jgi:hypothetical protein
VTLAAETRAAVRARPFLHTALRAGVVNYTAAARHLDLGGDEDREAVVAALRRYAEELDAYEPPEGDARVDMRSGLGPADEAGTDADLAVGGTAFVAGGGDLTGIVAAGDVGAETLAHALGRLRTEGIDVVAAGAAEGSLVVVVGRRDGPDALRTVEAALGG